MKEIYSVNYDMKTVVDTMTSNPGATLRLTAKPIRSESSRILVSDKGEIIEENHVADRSNEPEVEIDFTPSRASIATLETPGDDLEDPRLVYSKQIATLIAGRALRDNLELPADLRYEGDSQLAKLIITILQEL